MDLMSQWGATIAEIAEDMGTKTEVDKKKAELTMVYAVDKLLEEGVREVDQPRRRAIYQKLQEVLRADLPYLPIFAYVRLEEGDAKGALREFESVLKREPNRYRALAGAAQAAERAGDAKKAKQYAARLPAV